MTRGFFQDWEVSDQEPVSDLKTSLFMALRASKVPRACEKLAPEILNSFSLDMAKLLLVGVAWPQAGIGLH